MFVSARIVFSRENTVTVEMVVERERGGTGSSVESLNRSVHTVSWSQ